MLPLRPGELNTETDDVAHQYLRQHGQKAIAKDLKKRSLRQRTGCKVVLITHIVHAEEHRRHQSDDHHTHDALRVDTVVNIDTGLPRRVRHIEKSLKAIEHTLESMQLTPLLKVGLYFVDVVS